MHEFCFQMQWKHYKKGQQGRAALALFRRGKRK